MPRFRCAIILLLLTVNACATTNPIVVKAESSPTADFARYATYAWLYAPPEGHGRGPRSESELLDWRIRAAVDTQLAARGYQTTAAHPDFLVAYHIERTEKTTDSFSDYWRYRQSGGEADPAEAYVFGYEEGSLILEFTDARTRQLVWRASATAMLSADKQQERTQEAVRLMLRRLPAR